MSKIILCGECKKFAYEDAEGYGICMNDKAVYRCSDQCHITKCKAWHTTILTYVATSNAQSGSTAKGI